MTWYGKRSRVCPKTESIIEDEVERRLKAARNDGETSAIVCVQGMRERSGLPEYSPRQND